MKIYIRSFVPSLAVPELLEIKGRRSVSVRHFLKFLQETSPGFSSIEYPHVLVLLDNRVLATADKLKEGDMVTVFLPAVGG